MAWSHALPASASKTWDCNCDAITPYYLKIPSVSSLSMCVHIYMQEGMQLVCVYMFICSADLNEIISVSLRCLNTLFSAVGPFLEGLGGVYQGQQSSRFQTSHSIFC